MCLTLHFSLLNFSSHLLLHSSSFLRSSCSLSLSSEHITFLKIFTSSAKSLPFELSPSSRSLTYTRKSVGPRTLPCGTPLHTPLYSEQCPLTCTLCCQLARKSLIQLKTIPSTPTCFNLYSSKSCGTTSKALEQSRYTTSTEFPLSSASSKK